MGLGTRGGENFAELHRLDSNVWDAWLQRSPPEGERHLDPAVRLTRDGVSYEMALMAVFRAMGEEMPEEFAAVYICLTAGAPVPGPCRCLRR
jgi:hypothetical protein